MSRQRGPIKSTGGFQVGAVGTDITAIDASGHLWHGGVEIVPTAAQINAVIPLSVGSDRGVKVVRVALAAADTAGGVFAWANPESSAIIVERICLDVTTKSTGACTLDIGTTATNATTSSDNLLDGVDVGTAAGLFNNLNQAGTNGKASQRLATGKWVTASKASGAAAGLVGYVYIHYIVC